jgi:hypothetical protein
MAYIGKTPTIGNFQVCDAISVVNNQAAYTMQVGGVNVSPESANHMLVSLNGILQAPTSSFTVSGSTITFASNLVTGDVIDFIQILGNVLDLGVPSDATVSTAKIVDGAVTSAKLDSGVALGKVLQVVYTTYDTQTTIDSGAFTNLGLSLAITPSSTSSKILATWGIQYNIGDNRGFAGQLLRTIGASSTATFSDPNNNSVYINYANLLNKRGKTTYQYLDSPSTTSAITYAVQVKTAGDVQFQNASNKSYLTLTEVSA